MDINDLIKVVASKAELINQKFQTIEKKFNETNFFFKKMLNEKKCQDIREENKQLSQKVQSLITELTNLEKLNGCNVNIKIKTDIIQTDQNVCQANQQNEPQPQPHPQLHSAKVDSQHPQQSKKQESTPKEKKSEASKAADKDGEVNVSRLDFRIGRIINIKKHPDADSLYIEEVDVGDEKTRTVISGLVKHIPLEEMQNKMAVFLCNLKPAKMRGIVSEGMIMCANDGEKIEILIPPENCVPGDRVKFEKYQGKPDEQLNPKKKIWETIAPYLKTNSNCVATFKGDPFMVPGKGVIKSPSLANFQIK